MIAPRRLFIILGASACLAFGAFASPASAASPAWSPIGATGPTVIPAQQSEVQKLFVDAGGGTFKLTARHLAATGLGDLKNGEATVAKVATSSGAFAVGQVIEGSGIRSGTTIVAVGPGTLTMSQQPFRPGSQVSIAAYDTAATTPSLSYDITAADLQSALEPLSVVGPGNVSVSGGPGGPGADHPYNIVFGGTLANTNVSELTPDNTLLTGGNGANDLTTVPGGSGTSKLALMVQNVGGAASAGPITYKAALPAGITAVGVVRGTDWDCSASTSFEISCTSGLSVQPSLTPRPIEATLAAAPGVDGGVVDLEVSGGGASAAGTGQLPLTVSVKPAGPGVQSFTAGAFDEDGNLDTQAGGHPYSASTGIFVNTVRGPAGGVVPAGEFKDITVELPPGFLGNPIAVPACPESISEAKYCPLDTMVAVVVPSIENFGSGGIATSVYNTEAPYGYPAKFRFEIAGVEPLNVVGTLRSDGDYGLDASSLNTPQVASVYGTFFTFWGEPAAASHDAVRCQFIEIELGCEASDVDNTAFLTNATNCNEQAAIAAANGGLLPTNLKVTLWQNPGEVFRDSVGIPTVTGCDQLQFKSDFTFEPSDTRSDSPASFRTSLTVPSEGLTDPSKLTTPEVKDMVVTLPEGVVLNAAGADGLESCSLAQIGYKGNDFPMPNPIRFNRDPQSCPEASKIGTGELKTELLEEPLKGALYLAAQGDGNPYGSLFAIYLVIEDPRHGIFIKLPGRVDPDEKTGQMKVTFQNLPQLPFTRLDLNLKGGARSALASPTTCGDYVTTATGTPWSYPESGPPTVSANGFDIDRGPNGRPCAKTPAERPFDIGWGAGADSIRAGATAPFHMRVTRPDGSQELTGLSLKTPSGVSASLAGIPRCSEAQIVQARQSTGKAEQANPACPTASKVGTLTTGAGSGPSPFYVSGNLYLAGPYKGAPLSVVAITPAVAGPFDLGNVVVRNAVKIDRGTAQVSATSDEIPQILEGVVLRVRDVRITLDRKGWTINPTSCEPGSVNLTAYGNSGAVADRSARFQVDGCGELGFKPKFSARVIGGTKRGTNPAFEAKLSYPQGTYANLRDVQVALPHSEFLDQSHIRTICTRPQAAANACPQGAIYGYAEATTPLLDGKLTGPVFLKSSTHQLPDLAIFLKGPDDTPIEVEFQGRIDSIKGQLRNTIEGLPDVPVSSFRLFMKGGKKGLLVNSRNLCRGRPGRMTVSMAGQNNKRLGVRPRLGNSCGKKRKSSQHRRAKRVAKQLRIAGLLDVW